MKTQQGQSNRKECDSLFLDFLEFYSCLRAWLHPALAKTATDLNVLLEFSKHNQCLKEKSKGGGTSLGKNTVHSLVCSIQLPQQAQQPLSHLFLISFTHPVGSYEIKQNPVCCYLMQLGYYVHHCSQSPLLVLMTFEKKKHVSCTIILQM